MKTVLGHNSSLHYWRSHRLDETEPSKASSLRGCACARRDIDTVTLYRLGFTDSKVDLLVSSECARRGASGIELRYWKGSLPPGALRRIEGDIYVESPEMCFLQFAKRASLVETIFLGFELCGSYPTDEQGPGEGESLPAVTCRARLERFIARAPSHGGVRTARAALKYIRDDSASSMESAVTMLLCLPPRLGGYGLPFPEMNGSVKMGKKARDLGKKEKNRCDLYWRDAKLALEYNSERHHAGRQARTSDAIRANVLGYIDRTVVILTWDMLRDEDDFEGIARILCKHLKIRPPRIRIPREDFLLQRRLLRKTALPPLGTR